MVSVRDLLRGCIRRQVANRRVAARHSTGRYGLGVAYLLLRGQSGDHTGQGVGVIYWRPFG